MCAKFSIITVTYNAEKTLRQTIESVLAQTYSDFEYIIIDGASTDDSLDIVKSYSYDSRVHYISEPDKGIYDAMNKGISFTTGNIVSILNSDDFYEPDALENIQNAIKEMNIDTCFNKNREKNDNLFVFYGMIRVLKQEQEAMVLLNNDSNLPERMIMHPACFVSRNVYDKYKYDIQYKSAADYDLFLRLYQDKDVKFFPVYKILTNFRSGGMSSKAVSYIETNDIRYKYGYISAKQHVIGKIGLTIKKKLLMV